MAQIINEYRGLGSALGTGLGEGLSSGLQQLANMKLQSMSQRESAKQAARAYQGFGVPENVAQALAALSPEERKYPLQNLGALLQLGQNQGQQQAPAGLEALMLQGQQQQQPQESVQAAPQNLSAADLLSNPSVAPLIKQALSKAQVQSSKPQQPQIALPQSKGKDQLHTALQRQPVSTEDQAKLISDIFTSPEEKRRQRQEEREERKIASKETAERFKATKAERKEILDKSRSAKNDLRDLERMEELEKSGNLDTPGYVEFLKRSGLDIPALMNPESEEFQKIQLGFLRNAKSYYGGRISNYEVEQFLKTIPTLSQSPAGRRRVISNLKYLKRGEIAYKDALREVMQENNNVPPYDLLEQIDDRIDPKLDRLAAKLKEEIARPVPRGQNKLITALQSAAGSAIGSLSSGASSALKGAALGGLGSLGAGSGALLGTVFKI